MGAEYRFSVYFKRQIGLSISFEYGQILLRIPFLNFHFAVRKDADGILIFGREF